MQSTLINKYALHLLLKRRSKYSGSIITLLFFFFFYFACAFAYTALAAEDERMAQQQLDAVNASIADIEDWLVEADTRQDENQQRLKAIELDIAALVVKVAETETSLQATLADVELIASQRQQLNREKEEQSRLLSAIVRAAYMSGDSSAIKMLFNQESISDAARMMKYYQSFTKAQLDTIADYQTTLEELEVVTRNLDSRTDQLAEHQQALRQSLTALQQARQQRQQALDTLAEQIAGRNNELERLQTDQAELQQLIVEINRAIERIPEPQGTSDFAERRGTLPTPVTGQVITSFDSPYGDGSLRRQGVFIEAELGSPVTAVHGGRVVFADWLRGAGLLVIIDHGDGYMSLYGANQALTVNPGDRITAGDVVASSGQSMDSGESGLYFEIRHHGEPQNPSGWLAN